MKHTDRNGLVAAFLLGIAILFVPTAFAQLEQTDQFEEVEVIEEQTPVIVNSLPKARRVVRRRKAENDTPRVVVVQQGQSQQQQQIMAEPEYVEPKPETFGEKLSKRIDARLDAQRRQQEEELRRAEAARQAALLARIDTALNSPEATPEPAAQPAFVQPQQAPVQHIEPTFTTVQGDDYSGADIAGQSNSKSVGRKSNISIVPYFGFSNLSTDSYDIDAGTSFGGALAFEWTEDVVVNFGYTYSQYDIRTGQNTFAFNNGFNNNNTFLNNGQFNRLEYNQNLFDAGIRYMLFSKESTVRPFIGGGGAYSLGFVNYRQSDIDDYTRGSFSQQQQAGVAFEDYEVGGLAAYVHTGFLVNFSRSFGMAASFRYYAMVSSKDDNTSQYGFFNNGNNNTVNLNRLREEKESVGRSISDSNWTTLDFALVVTF